MPRRLWELAALFLKLGTIGFGGPAVHIATMEDEVVRRRGWMSSERFLDLVGATHLIPGPNSTEMAIHIGYVRAGWLGLAVAGTCFIVPAVLITAAAASAYVAYGSLPQVEPFLYGIKPAVLGVIAMAVVRLGRTAAKTPTLVLLGLAVGIAVGVGADPVVALFAGGLMGPLARWWAGRRHHGRTTISVAAAGITALISPAVRAAASPLETLSLAAAVALPRAGATLDEIGLFFLKVGAVLYGGGYVLIVYLKDGLVAERGWLTNLELMDAIAVGQLTPGPILSTATFVGYLLAGFNGAVVATVAIFLPSFVFVVLVNPWIPRLRARPCTAAFLDAINASAVGLMVAVLIQLSYGTLFDPGTGSFHWPVAAIAVGSVAVIIWKRPHAAWLVLGGALIGRCMIAVGL